LVLKSSGVNPEGLTVVTPYFEVGEKREGGGEGEKWEGIGSPGIKTD
jgi:hypothetical protein